MKKNRLELRDLTAEQKRQWVRVTRACNNQCLFCHDIENQNNLPVPFAEIIWNLAEGRRSGAERVVISGGEPTVNPRIFEIIKQAKKMGYKHVQIITNGRMLAYGDFGRKLKNAGLDEITFSLHSHLKGPFEKITRVKGSYIQSMRGLSNALKLNFIVSVDIVINKLNFKKLKETLEFFIKMGVFEFDLLYLIPFGNAWKNKDALF
ncbi:MAG: radical SAM protein, partial [Candidatus Berkelbacteria bacterium]|nr:radical SAM protein [Candidatus Berkelbacteria bacterium]